MVKPKTLTEAAYEDIKQWILEGEITPGSKISLEDTASRLEVSMTPIREALTKLQQPVGGSQNSQRKPTSNIGNYSFFWS